MSTARTTGPRALEAIAEIPGSATGKILRRVLKERQAGGGDWLAALRRAAARPGSQRPC